MTMSFVGGQVEYVPQLHQNVSVTLTNSNFQASYPQLLSFNSVVLNGGSLSVSSSSAIGRLEWLNGSVTFNSATIGDLLASGSPIKTFSATSKVTVSSSFSMDSPWRLAGGAQVTLACNGTLSSGSSVDGIGSLVIDTGRHSTGLWVSGGLVDAFAQVKLVSGTIGVAAGGTLNLRDFTWSAGTLAGPGSIILLNELAISSSDVIFATGSDVQNSGTVVWNVPSAFTYVPTSLGLLTNIPGGVLTVTGTSAVTLPVRLENKALGSVHFQTPVTIPELTNAGTIEAVALTVKSLGTCSGSISVDGAFVYSGSGTTSFACALEANEFNITSGSLATSGSVGVVQVYLFLFISHVLLFFSFFFF